MIDHHHLMLIERLIRDGRPESEIDRIVRRAARRDLDRSRPRLAGGLRRITRLGGRGPRRRPLRSR